MVRALTEAEARVIGALLASTRVTERSRLQRAGVPRSTYHAARRRAYQEGWLRDRYVPDPVQFGWPYAVVLLVRPFADRHAEYVADRAADPSTVYLAHSPGLAISVGWYPRDVDAREVVRRTAAGGRAAWSFPIVADLRTPSLPVYFDYEGSFAHLGKVAGAEGYPQGLGGAPAEARRADRPAAELRASWAATELVHRPFPVEADGRASHLVGPLGLPWGQQKLLNQGWIRHRVLLDPGRLPPFQGRSAGQQVLLGGTMKPGARPEELFAALTRQCRVYPFLFVAVEGRLLLGALGEAPGSPAPESAEGGRPSVLRTLQERVEGIEILAEPAAAFELTVDHRYDRLFPRRPAAA